MKKKIIAFAIAVLGIFSVNVNAQDNVRGAAPMGNDKMYRPQTFTDFAFEGILLDVNQQARIDSLNAAMMPKGVPAKNSEVSCKDNCKGNAEKCDGKKCDKKCDGKKCDGKKCDKKCDKKEKGNKGENCGNCPNAQKPQRMGNMPPKGNFGPAPRKEYIAKVKEILTPEQYVVFLENISSMPQQMGPKMHNARGPQSRGEMVAPQRNCDKACEKAPKLEKAPKGEKK